MGLLSEYLTESRFRNTLIALLFVSLAVGFTDSVTTKHSTDEDRAARRRGSFGAFVGISIVFVVAAATKYAIDHRYLE